ncbi:hypothetical protein [Blautia faecicola]|uniref:hypothetical protein n=1 Tax=Blautia faecicola TaxID=2509240 RepID=UPI0013E96C20|nr:hypothetical protein [Blautia faecicola]
MSDSTKKTETFILNIYKQTECHLAGFGDLGGKKRKAAVPQRFRILKLIESALDEEEGGSHESKGKKRLLALVLCMVVALSNSSFIFASETGQTEYPQEAEVQTQDEAVANDMDVAAYAADEGQAVAEEQTAPVEQVTAEPVAEPETNRRSSGRTADSGNTCSRTADNRSTCSRDTCSPRTCNCFRRGQQQLLKIRMQQLGKRRLPQEEENGETVTYNQKMDLKQDFTDELGNVIATVSAEIPEGAFQVGESSQITMEVNTLTDAEKAQLENLMKEKIPAEKNLVSM